MWGFLRPSLLTDHHCFSPESTDTQQSENHSLADNLHQLLSGHVTALTLDRGAAVPALAAGFPVPVAAAAPSAFPRSPLALLTAGRTDFFMLSSLTPTHLQPNLCTKGGGEEEEER